MYGDVTCTSLSPPLTIGQLLPTIGRCSLAIGVGSVVRCSAEFLDPFGSVEMTTWDLEVLTAGSGGNDGFRDDVLDYMSALYNFIAGYVASGASYYQVQYYHRNGTEVLPPAAWAGDDALAGGGDPLPPAVSALLFFRTAMRRVIARKFLPVMTEPANADGAPYAPLITAMEGMGGYAMADHTMTLGWRFQLVCWSSTLPGSVTLLEAVPSANWAIQRRRRIGRGI